MYATKKDKIIVSVIIVQVWHIAWSIGSFTYDVTLFTYIKIRTIIIRLE